MTKPRQGFRVLFVQIHSEVWDALDAEATAKQSSLAKVVDRALAKYCRIDLDKLTPPRRAGRPPKSA